VVLMGCTATESLARVVRHDDDSQGWTGRLLRLRMCMSLREKGRGEVEEYALG
jgi:hypothetical protein